MSSKIGKLKKKLSGKARRGPRLNSRGKPKGSASTPRAGMMPLDRATFAPHAGGDWDLTAAKPSCRHCHGTGSPGGLMHGADSIQLVCVCVPRPTAEPEAQG